MDEHENLLTSQVEIKSNTNCINKMYFQAICIEKNLNENLTHNMVFALILDPENDWSKFKKYCPLFYGNKGRP